MGMKKSCENCQYYKQHIDSNCGQCRRFPPVPVWHYNRIETDYPITHKYEWCGEFKEKKVT